ncbi:ABC transporter permease [Rhodobacter sp. CZR27]|uniref:ABC transporter permease n=1 Tax=Rhodobacter sp. CZR27 TaxID=2033869 RepID=UPI000BBECC1B|nr:ABC transporter permease [Rhodobacter sp. CZR27]
MRAVLRGLAVQGRVITTLTLRETRATFGTSRVGYLWAILVPVISIGLLVAIFTTIGRAAPYGISLALFFASGVLVIELFNKLATALMACFDANRALMAYPLVKPIDTLLARTLLIAMTYAVIMVLIHTGLAAAGLAETPAWPERIAGAFGAIVLLGFGFGGCSAVIASFWPSWTHVEKIVTRPLIFISGVFYVPSALPEQARDILWWNPVLHLVEWMRTGLYRDYDSMVLTPLYPAGLGLFLTLLVLASERVTRSARSLT